MRVCQNCNREVEDNKADFCPKCGKTLAAETKDELKRKRNTGNVLLFIGIPLFALGMVMLPAILSSPVVNWDLRMIIDPSYRIHSLYAIFCGFVVLAMSGVLLAIVGLILKQR